MDNEMTATAAWALLYFDLDSDATEAQVKQTYAARLKRIDRATDVEGFQTLRHAYEDALAYARAQREAAAATAPAPTADAGARPLESAAAATGTETALEPEKNTEKEEQQEEREQEQEQEQEQAHPASPAPAEMPTQRATPPRSDDFFPDFAAQFQALYLFDFADAVNLLRNFRRRRELSSLAARDALQHRLIRALGTRELGRHSALLFFAAVEVFGWDRNFPPAGPTPEDADAWQRVDRWIDAACVLGPEEHRLWRSFAAPPNAETLYENLGDSEPVDWTLPLHSLCCEPDEVHEWQRLDLLRWHELSSARPAPSSPQPSARNREAVANRRRPLRWWDRLYALLFSWKVMAPLIIVLGVVGALWAEERKMESDLGACTQHFQQASLAHFKGLTLAQVDILRQCVRGRYQPTCEETVELGRLEALALILADRRVELNDFGLSTMLDRWTIALFPAEDPVPIAYRGTACSSGYADFVTRGAWLRLGDERLARQVTAEAARCWAGEKQKGLDPAGVWRDSWAYELLSRTDVWQDVAQAHQGESGTAGVRIPLKSLLTRDPRLSLLEAGGPLPTTASCRSERAAVPQGLTTQAPLAPPLSSDTAAASAAATDRIAAAVKILEQAREQKNRSAP